MSKDLHQQLIISNNGPLIDNSLLLKHLTPYVLYLEHIILIFNKKGKWFLFVIACSQYIDINSIYTPYVYCCGVVAPGQWWLKWFRQ